MNRPRSRSPLHLDAVGALAARGVLLLVVLGGLAAATAPAQAPPAKNAAACCGADSTYHATWTDPATGQVLGAREPVSIRYVINPAPGCGAGPGDPDGTGQTLHVSPCAVVALYGAGGTDADVCVRNRSAQGLPPEVVVLWEGVQPCVDGAHAGESAVASRYDWLSQLGEVIPALPRHQVIDFGTLAPGSYTLTFLSHEGQGCCNAGTENVAAQITIVSDPAVSCAAARALGRGDFPPDPADPTQPSCQVACLDCQPDLAEWVCDRTGHPDPSLPYEFDEFGVAIFPIASDLSAIHAAYSRLFKFTTIGVPSGLGRFGSERIIAYNKTRILSATTEFVATEYPPQHSKHAFLPHLAPYESGDTIRNRDCTSHLLSDQCLPTIADSYQILASLMPADAVWLEVEEHAASHGHRWFIEVLATFEEQTIWVDRQLSEWEVILPSGDVAHFDKGTGGVQVGGPFGPSTIKLRYWYQFAPNGELQDASVQEPVLTGELANLSSPERGRQ